MIKNLLLRAFLTFVFIAVSAGADAAEPPAPSDVWPSLSEVDHWLNRKGFPDCIDCPGPIPQEVGQKLKQIIEKRLPFSFTKIPDLSTEHFVYYKAEREGVTIYLHIRSLTDKDNAVTSQEMRWSPDDPHDILG